MIIWAPSGWCSLKVDPRQGSQSLAVISPRPRRLPACLYPPATHVCVSSSLLSGLHWRCLFRTSAHTYTLPLRKLFWRVADLRCKCSQFCGEWRTRNCAAVQELAALLDAWVHVFQTPLWDISTHFSLRWAISSFLVLRKTCKLPFKVSYGETELRCCWRRVDEQLHWKTLLGSAFDWVQQQHWSSMFTLWKWKKFDFGLLWMVKSESM